MNFKQTLFYDKHDRKEHTNFYYFYKLLKIRKHCKKIFIKQRNKYSIDVYFYYANASTKM